LQKLVPVSFDTVSNFDLFNVRETPFAGLAPVRAKTDARWRIM